MLHFTRDAQATDLPFEIFKGVNGDTLQTSILPMLGIGKVIYTTRGDPTQRKNLGTIGCYLSHRYLYEKIVKEDPDLDGCYLIFEDDATFPPDFQDILQDTLRDVPKDWDIIYLSKNGKIAATPVTSIISKLKKQEDSASNFGTWAQIYRVRFLKEELLPYLKNMTDEIDTQIVRKFDEWNAYCYIPSLVLIQPGSKSGIDPVD
jgi:GR25 family glycosyltransferase involved in LPS biosynthesis